MLFNEPKLLKCFIDNYQHITGVRFSALQRAEIAEIAPAFFASQHLAGFSALQRAEIAEICVDLAIVEYAPEFQCSSTSRNC